MRVVIVSKSFILKEALEFFFKNKLKFEDISVLSDIQDVKTAIKDKCLIFVEINETNIDMVENLLSLKSRNNRLKIIGLDSTSNKRFFIKCIKGNIDGYITNVEDKNEFDYIISSIILDKKFYDPCIIKEIITDGMYIKSDSLTKREIEVMTEVANGLNNKDIAKKLYITEYTVKKKINSIFNKLNFKNRKDIIIYLNKKERRNI